MSDNVVNLNQFKARREKKPGTVPDPKHNEKEHLKAEPAFKAFQDILTPTPITPDNMIHFLRETLYHLQTRFNKERIANHNITGIFNAHLTLTSHSFANSALIESATSFEAHKKEYDPKVHARIKNKALQDNAYASAIKQNVAVKDAFMAAMIGETYAYRAAAKQIKAAFPGFGCNPAFIQISPQYVIPTIEIHVPERKGHDLIARLERYLYKFQKRHQDGNREPPPHLKPV